MKMLNTELVFVLQLFELLFRRFLIMLLVFRSRLNGCVDILTNEQDLAVFVVEVLGLDLRPGQVAKLFDNPVSKLVLST